MKEEQPYCVKLDDTIASLIEIRRFGEIEGGFQRNLDTKYLVKIQEAAAKGEAIPPILLAKVDSKFRLIDGQHRFASWLGKHFDLWAQVNPLAPQKVVESFCTINGTSRKITLKHQLNVDPSKYAQEVRVTAKKFGIEPRTVHALLSEITNKQKGRNLKVTADQWKFLSDFLSAWTSDKRWKNDGYVYSKYGCLLMSIRLCMKSKSPMSMVKKVQSLDFKNGSPLSERYGTNFITFRSMHNYAVNSLINKGAM